MKFPFFMVVMVLALCSQTTNAQYSAQNDAMYLATIKAVANYKINDEETLQQVESLRQNKMFNAKLQRMLNKLSNKRSKDTTNQKVLDILEKAGKDIYNLLD